MNAPSSRSESRFEAVTMVIIVVSAIVIIGAFVYEAFGTRWRWVVLSSSAVQVREAEVTMQALEAECEAMERELFLAVDFVDSLQRDIRGLGRALPPRATDLEWATALRNAAIECAAEFARRHRSEP